MAMLDTDRLIEECRAAARDGGDRASRAAREVVARAVADPGAVLAALGEPRQGGVRPIHRSAELTILDVAWPEKAVIMPHNHAMWAVIGVYTGREDNILWRRLPGEADGRIEAGGARTLGARDTLVLGPDAIHSVVNPLGRITGAIHVYGGDFFGVARSEWDPEELREKPYDMEKVLRMFAQRRD